MTQHAYRPGVSLAKAATSGIARMEVVDLDTTLHAYLELSNCRKRVGNLSDCINVVRGLVCDEYASFLYAVS